MHDPNSKPSSGDRNVPPGPILPAPDDDAYRTMVADQQAETDDGDVEAPFRKTISLRNLPGIIDDENSNPEDTQTFVIDPDLLAQSVDQTVDFEPIDDAAQTRDIIPPLPEVDDDMQATRVNPQYGDVPDIDPDATRIPDADEAALMDGADVDPDATRVPKGSSELDRGGEKSIEDMLQVRTRPVAGFPFGADSNCDYQVKSRVGQGAMGVVYGATQTSLNRDITFKTLKSWWESLAQPLREQLPDDQYKDAINQLREKGTLSPALTQQLRAKMKAEDYEQFSGYLRSTAQQSARSSQTNQTTRDLFLSEAVVTSNLVHPNIVPIHDMGRMEDGTLFYSMKWVHGKPWDSCILEMDLHENLAKLLAVCDAMAFAHDQGVINRDLKPENVMLGEYGEVLVLDWGLAVPLDNFEKKDQITNLARPGAGTPVYMAPELVTGPMEKIGTHSDIYLLGAILFEVVTGTPPHDFSDTRDMNPREKTLRIIKVVGQNIIRDPGFGGELIDIALKAMSTEPEDRFGSVVEFQKAIRDYLRHEESLRLSTRATELLDQAHKNPSKRGYSDFQNASALYEEAIYEWPENPDAEPGLKRAKLEYAQFAHTKGDYDLGLHVLDGQTDEESSQQRKRLKNARALRRSLKWAVLASLAVILVGGWYSTWKISNLHGSVTQQQEELKVLDGKRQEAETATANAEKQKAEAIQLASSARTAAEKAGEDRDAAINRLGDVKEQLKNEEQKVLDAEKEAALAKADADREKEKAESERFAARAARAEANKAKLDEKAARQKLANVEESLTEANAAKLQAEFRSEQTEVEGFIRTGQYSRAIPLLKKLIESDNEFARRHRGPLQATLKKAEANSTPTDRPIETGAISRDQRTIAYIQNDLQADKSQIILQVAASVGKDAKKRTLSANSAVHSVAVSDNGRIAAAAAENRILVWSENRDAPVTVGRHAGKITALRLSKDGRYVFSVSADRTLMVHDARTRKRIGLARQESPIRDLVVTNDARTIILVMGEGKQSICKALSVGRRGAGLEFESRGQLKLPANERVPFAKVSLSADEQLLALMPESDGRVFVIPRDSSAERDKFPFAVDDAANPSTWQLVGHIRSVNDVAISSDASTLITASDDYTLGVWKKSNNRWQRTQVLKGHGGAVESCGFLPGSPNRIVSMSRDRYIRVWDLDDYDQQRESLLKLTRDPLNQNSAMTKPYTGWPGLERRRSETPELRPTFNRTNAAAFSAYAFASHTDNLEDSPAAKSKEASTAKTHSKKNTAQTPPTKKFRGNAREVLIRKHESGVLSARFSKDGTRVLTASRDQTARIWNLRDTRKSAPKQQSVFEEGHTYSVNSLLFLPPTGKKLVTTSRGSLSVWDTEADKNGIGRQVARLTKLGPTAAIASSADGRWLVSTAAKNSALLWDMNRVLKSVRPQPAARLTKQHKFPVTVVAVSPAGKYLLTGDRRGRLVLWTTPDGELIGEVKQAHSADQISALEFLSETEFLSAGYDGKIKLWTIDAEADPPLVTRRNYNQGDGYVTQLAVDKAGEKFLTATRRRDKKIWQTKLTQWNVDSKEPQRDIVWTDKKATEEKPDRLILSIDWSADGKQAVIADGVVLTFLRTRDWSVIMRLGDQNQTLAADGAVFHPQKEPRQLATAARNAAHLWNLKSGKHLASFRAHAAVFSADYSADESIVATASRSIRIFRADARGGYGQTLFKIEQPHRGPVSQIRFSPLKDSHQFVSVSVDGTAKVWKWNADEQRAIQQRKVDAKGNQTHINIAVWSPNGKSLLTAGRHGLPHVWPANSSASPVELKLPKTSSVRPHFLSGAFSADENWIAVCGYDEATEESVGWIWKKTPADEPANSSKFVWRPHCRIEGHGQGGISAVCFSHDGSYVLTGGRDGAAFVWDWLPDATPLSKGELLSALRVFSYSRPRQPDAHRGRITAIDASPTGQVVTASEDGTAIVWPAF